MPNFVNKSNSSCVCFLRLWGLWKIWEILKFWVNWFDHMEIPTLCVCDFVFCEMLGCKSRNNNDLSKVLVVVGLDFGVTTYSGFAFAHKSKSLKTSLCTMIGQEHPKLIAKLSYGSITNQKLGQKFMAIVQIANLKVMQPNLNSKRIV